MWKFSSGHDPDGHQQNPKKLGRAQKLHNDKNQFAVKIYTIGLIEMISGQHIQKKRWVQNMRMNENILKKNWKMTL